VRFIRITSPGRVMCGCRGEGGGVAEYSVHTPEEGGLHEVEATEAAEDEDGL
jgi:hypothetical protein